MTTQNPADLATELRLRAQELEGQERAELLFLAAEYDRMAEEAGPGMQSEWRGVALPK